MLWHFDWPKKEGLYSELLGVGAAIEEPVHVDNYHLDPRVDE